MITTLTKEQENKIPEYLEKGLKIGLRTKTVNKTKAKQSVKYLYETILNMKTPKKTIFVKGPLEAQRLLRKLTKTNDYIYPSFRNLFCSYYVFYDYIGTEVVTGQDITQKNKEFLAAISEFFEVFLYEEVAIIVDFPSQINMVDGRLHKDGGPSVVFRDGFKMYNLNGIGVTKKVAEIKANKITKDFILAEQNADIRREIIRKLPDSQLIKVLKPEVKDTQVVTLVSGRKLSYELYLIDFLDGEKRPYLKMTNPSEGIIHVEGVDRNVSTVMEALKYRNGGRTGLPIELT